MVGLPLPTYVGMETMSMEVRGWRVDGETLCVTRTDERARVLLLTYCGAEFFSKINFFATSSYLLATRGVYP